MGYKDSEIQYNLSTFKILKHNITELHTEKFYGI